MEIFPLSEGAFTIDQTKLFVPFDTDTDDLQARAKGSLLVEVQPFLVKTTKDLLLFDAGLGFRHGGALQLHNNIRAAGFDPASVTRVLMSHLHKDHAGGMSQAAVNGRETVFPAATYHIQQRELAYAYEKGFSSYIVEELEFINSSANIQLLEGNGSISGYIRYEMTGGHCPFHQVFHVEEDGEHIFFGGDVAPQLSQMQHKFVAKYDYDGRKCADLRQKWWKQGGDENWTFLFYHDIATPTLKGGSL